ncbi:hypothetical protein GPECTOR_35g838 [Gonium pectorale]|uniref:Uncharacterized protein n=1 Tax=Gonium pectorale TaxID=33097 RepID=A0A150GDI0_GONPE|nr:hypothetical protein GPECTOR_35g838 [Gonium pectorale]|eukprot:KXZ47400.1 hypothetical protein GPECTOR_35g838 [Gonium pectorale]
MRLSVSKYAFDRKRVYDAMGSGVRHKGLELGGVVTQGLRQADLYRITHDTRSNRVLIMPILHPLEVPVRAMILPLRDRVAAGKIRDAVRELLLPVLPEGGIWLQDDALYHATLYHASSHVVGRLWWVGRRRCEKPIRARPEVIAEEEQSIRAVCDATCPINAVLERLVVTTTGVVVACWQVLPDGGEPALLRAALGAALPNAPPREAQMVKEPAMLHTTVARLLLPPNSTQLAAAAAAVEAVSAAGRRRLLASDSQTQHLQQQGVAAGLEAATERTESSSGGSAAVAAVDSDVVVRAVEVLSATLCGLRAQFGEVWFIEEQDLLALALNGRYIKHVAPLSCPAEGAAAEAAGQGAAAAA